MEQEVLIVRKRGVKRWRLSVDRDGRAVFTASLSTSQKTIDDALKKHKNWIAKHAARRLNAIEKARKLYKDREGLIPLLGEWIAPPSGDLNGFYRKEALTFFSKECDRLAAVLDVCFNKIRIADQISRYGSCSVKKTLSFNWRIVKSPLFVAKYIAAHEIAHLNYMNHKRDFWNCVASIAPDFLEAEKWLKENGDFLRFDIC
ncbi:MAG: M48 family metallopeptidase [Helicobacteraceae bacterium]|jgi:predicted metal-dependent hydrolase|nr:M48 family metallopeptidase [Helicobacteraceae bacterium]